MSDGKSLAFVCLHPHKMPFGLDESHPACISLQEAVREQLVKLIEDGSVTNFVAGIGMGMGMICAELVLELQTRYPHIKLDVAIAFKDGFFLWPEEHRVRYRAVLERSAHIHTFDKKPSDDPIEKRDQYMVNKCDTVLALWNGKPGGTGCTVEYAVKKKKNIITINPFDFAG